MGHLVQPSCPSRVTQSRLHRTLSSRVWNISREGDSTVSLGSLFQCSVTLLLRRSHILCPPGCPRKDELPIDWFTAFMHRFSISTLLGAWPVALGWKGEVGKT